jgi:hypothetical protein
MPLLPARALEHQRRCELIERGLPIPEGLREGREKFRDHGPTTTTTTTAARGGGGGEEEEEGVRRRDWGFVDPRLRPIAVNVDLRPVRGIVRDEPLESPPASGA